MEHMCLDYKCIWDVFLWNGATDKHALCLFWVVVVMCWLLDSHEPLEIHWEYIEHGHNAWEEEMAI